MTTIARLAPAQPLMGPNCGGAIDAGVVRDTPSSTRRRMQPPMVRHRGDFQIGDAVVLLVPVLVMDDLGSKKGAAEVFFHYPSMLEDVATVDSHESVSVSAGCSPTVPVVVLLAGREPMCLGRGVETTPTAKRPSPLGDFGAPPLTRMTRRTTVSAFGHNRNIAPNNVVWTWSGKTLSVKE